MVAAAEELATDPSTALSIEQVRALIQADGDNALTLQKTQSVTALKGMFNSTAGPVSIANINMASGPTVRRR